MYGYWGAGHVWGGGLFGWGWLFWIVILVAAVWIIVRVVSNRSYRGESGGGQESAMDILKKRYAKGEITKEQYDQMKKDLGS
jgi:putative membrane protein